jgi:3D (Asp-Asp-Asp) domain-containing protein
MRLSYTNFLSLLNPKFVSILLFTIILANTLIPAHPANAEKSDNLANLSIDIANSSTKTIIRTSDKIISDNEQPDKTVKAVITAYTSTKDQTDGNPFRSASGKTVYDGMIASNWLPFGTKIKIPSLYGDKIFTVDDRMNKKYGYGRLDVWLDSTKTDAKKFGVKHVDVEVYYANSSVAKAPGKDLKIADATK